MKKILLTPLLALLFLGISQAAISQEIGMASYYNDKFQGRKTASGDKYDRNKMTCAHNTYPFGTLLKVTRLDNQKSVVVRVNDRGPHISGRIVDVSWAAAKKLDLVNDGVAKVKVEVYKPVETKTEKKPSPPKLKSSSSSVGKDKPTSYDKEETNKKISYPKEKAKEPGKTAKKRVEHQTAASSKTAANSKTSEPLLSPEVYASGNGLYNITITSSPGGFATQIGSYTDFDNAVKEITRLHAKGFREVLVKMETPPNGITRYKLLVGLRPSRKEAEIYKNNLLKKYKIKGFVVEVRP